MNWMMCLFCTTLCPFIVGCASTLTPARGSGGAAGRHGLFHGVDGGNAWTQIPGVENALVIGLGKAAPDAEYQALYSNSKIKGRYDFYLSNDAGATWARLNGDAPKTPKDDKAIALAGMLAREKLAALSFKFAGFDGGQGNYICALATTRGMRKDAWFHSTWAAFKRFNSSR